jgi:hypothetical protein
MRTTDKPNGPAAAAILAAAIGVFVIGLMTTLVAVSDTLGAMLRWVDSVGPLSGKTGLGLIAWLLAWVVLRSTYGGKNVDADGIIRWSWVLIAVGLLLTFPPVFDRVGRLFR